MRDWIRRWGGLTLIVCFVALYFVSDLRSFG